MTFDEYQLAACRTRKATDELGSLQLLLRSVTYLSVEVAEIGELAQRWDERGERPEVKALIIEAGDVLWRLADLCTAHGITLEAVARGNVEKLAQRHPRGFEPVAGEPVEHVKMGEGR